MTLPILYSFSSWENYSVSCKYKTSSKVSFSSPCCRATFLCIFFIYKIYDSLTAYLHKPQWSWILPKAVITNINTQCYFFRIGLWLCDADCQQECQLQGVGICPQELSWGHRRVSLCPTNRCLGDNSVAANQGYSKPGGKCPISFLILLASHSFSKTIPH